MPAGRGVQFVVLAEDQLLERFIRGCLYALGVRIHEIRFLTSPVARGSAKQWIDREYPGQVRAHRQYARENRALIVGTDADEYAVRQRIHRLDDALREAGLDPRSPAEKIAILVPRWHIETWLLHLWGLAVDEHTDYKRQVRDAGIDIKAAAQAFIGRFRASDSNGCLPSIVEAFEEMRRIQAALDRAEP